MQVMKIRSEKGFSLVETIVSLALLGTIGVSFLSGLATTSSARVTADEQASAKILAETLLDHIKKEGYASSYNCTIPDEFSGYSANITVDNIKNDEIQKLTIRIAHQGDEVFTLESYKVRRYNN